jgi:hypothetical protein
MPDAFLQFTEAARFRLPGPEQRLMDILRREAARTTDNDFATLLFPFQD